MSATEAASGAHALPGARGRWPRGLTALTIALAALAPLAVWSGRVPGLGEFDYLIYYRLLFYNDFANALAMLAALLLALAIPALRLQAERLAGWLSVHPVHGCLLAFAGLAVLARVVYQGFPLAMDEYAPLLQARIFAQGDIAASYPRELLDHMVVPGFQGSFILVNHDTGQAMSGYWPGLALLMAPFATVGLEWLLNPILGAIGLWLIGDLARQASGVEQARGWAMLAALACPQYTINAISYYAMPGLLTLNLLYLWLLLRPDAKAALLAGVVGSLALVMHNPVPHILFAIPCMAWLLAGRERRGRLLPLALGYLPLAALLGLGWPWLTSTMGLRPLDVAASQGEFVSSWLNKLQRTFAMPGMEMLQVRSYAAWKTLIWAAPGLLLTAFLARSSSPIPRLLLWALLLAYAFYFFFPYDQGHGWGYRYIHPAWGVVPVVAGIFAVARKGPARGFVAAAACAGLLATPVFLFTTHRTIATSVALDIRQPTAEHTTYVFVANQPALYSVDLIRNYPADAGRLVRMYSQGMDADRALVTSVAPGAVLLISDRRGSAWRVPADTRTRGP